MSNPAKNIPLRLDKLEKLMLITAWRIKVPRGKESPKGEIWR